MGNRLWCPHILDAIRECSGGIRTSGVIAQVCTIFAACSLVGAAGRSGAEVFLQAGQGNKLPGLCTVASVYMDHSIKPLTIWLFSSQSKTASRTLQQDTFAEPD